MNYYISVLKNYAKFDGRARRSEFWYFVLISNVIAYALTYLGVMVNESLGLVGNLYNLAVLCPSIAVGIRRMHDIDKSGWFILIPIYNIILAATAGTAGNNSFGADPKAAAAA